MYQLAFLCQGDCGRVCVRCGRECAQGAGDDSSASNAAFNIANNPQNDDLGGKK